VTVQAQEISFYKKFVKMGRAGGLSKK